jgi:plastocyanin
MTINASTGLAGATGTSYTISAVTAGQNGYQYRAVFTNKAGSATTTAATLTVQYAPTVTKNPRSVTVTAGQSVTFTTAATGNPTVTVQWQVSTDGGNTFTNIAGATGTSYTIVTTTKMQNGYR